MTQPTICLKCRLERVCNKNNFLVCDIPLEEFPEIYWLGEEWRCARCDTRIVTCFGKPFQEKPDPKIWGRVVEFRR